MQREITTPCYVFERDGEVMQAGWARKPMFAYNKSKSKATRHCERDCYFVNNGEASMYLCVENYGRHFAVKIAVADLLHGGVIHDCIIKKTKLRQNRSPRISRKGRAALYRQADPASNHPQR